MIKTKFVFAVSMVAMMAVNVANAEIAATSYVDKGVTTATNAANAAQTSANAANTAAGKAQTSANNAQEAADNAQASADAAAASAKTANYALASKANTADLAKVATSGSYNDLTNKPTIPTVNNATLTIQKNGANVATFTANSGTAATANITVPTKVSELTNDSSYATTTQLNTVKNELSDGNTAAIGELQDQIDGLATVASTGSYNDLSNKPTIGNATLTIQKNSVAVDTFTANATTAKTINITVPTKVSELTNDSNYATTTAVNAKVTTAQGSSNANKAVITNASGNITTGTITSGMITDGTIKNVDIATDAAIAASKISGLATVATSGSYADLSNKPTIPTVNNATLTIQKNGATVDTFTANASANKSINITVPTKVSELTNDSSYATTTQLNTVKNELSDGNTAAIGELQEQIDDLATVASSGSYNDLSNKPTIGNATLTIQKNGVAVDTFTANATTAKTINITVPTKVTDLSDAASYATTTAVNAKEATVNKLTSTATTTVSDTNKDTLYPSVGKVQSMINALDVTDSAQTGKYVSAVSETDGKITVTRASLPTIPTVNNATLTIQKNGANVATFTANSGTAATANITVPTKVSELTNDSSYATTTQLNTVKNELSDGNTAAIGGLQDQIDDLATVASTGSYTDLTNKPTIGTSVLTIKNGATNANIATFGANATAAVTATIPAATASVAGLAKIGIIPSGTDKSGTAEIWVE